MPPEFQPSSDDLARYLEQRGELTKPWNLQMLRLKKLRKQRTRWILSSTSRRCRRPMPI